MQEKNLAADIDIQELKEFINMFKSLKPKYKQRAIGGVAMLKVAQELKIPEKSA